VKEKTMKRLKMCEVRSLIEMAVVEDYGKGDLTSELTIGKKETAKAQIVTREEIVVCGMDVVREILRHYDKKLRLRVFFKDGQRANVGVKLGVIEGPLRPMLSAERVVLNFLQRLCGVATMTWKFVSAVRGTGTKIYDTRKTTPGWRVLEKYAVRCGGGYNHRFSLNDGVLIKDNHIAQLGKNFYPKLRKIVEQARKSKKTKFVMVEVDHVDNQLNYVLKIPGIDVVLLDNMGQWQLKHAVDMRNKMCGKRPLLEASGNITLNNVMAVAQCGIDRIAVGAITHSAASVDIGLDRGSEFLI
jgi:nicotinate-nucleotide pyrophosphorylase (carboxylating)